MTKLLTASITVVLTALIFVSYRAFEENGEKILNCFALSVMATLIELDMEPGQTAQVEQAQAGVLVADGPNSAPALQPRATIATRVAPLPPLKPLPKPLCTSAPRAQFASFRTDALRLQRELFLPQDIQTGFRVAMPAAAQTGDWAEITASCRERSLKACIEKSRNMQRVVILAPGMPGMASFPITIELPDLKAVTWPDAPAPS